MKSLRMAFIGSVLVNVFLLGIVFFGRPPLANGDVQGRSSKAIASATPLRAGDAQEFEHWRQFKIDNLPHLVAQLRQLGYPPAIIRAMISTLVNEDFRSKRKELLSALNDVPYWKNPSGAFAFETRAALRELSRERAQVLARLLGQDVVSQTLIDPLQGRAYANIPVEKTPAVQSILSDYAEMRSLVRDQMNGVMLAEDREKLALLEKEEQADLAAVLTPEELLDFEVRNSKTALELRGRLGIFNPTEDEFRAIFKLQRAFDHEYGAAIGNSAKESNARRQAGQEALQENIKKALTPERYADYQLSSDLHSQPTNRLLARYGHSIESARQTRAIQEDVTRKLGVLEASHLAPDQFNRQLVSLRNDTEAKLTGILGPETFAAYKQMNGAWLGQLQPRPQRVMPVRK